MLAAGSCKLCAKRFGTPDLNEGKAMEQQSTINDVLLA
jgi:hypothetical protein